jgi:NAD(P)H-flavin reductase
MKAAAPVNFDTDLFIPHMATLTESTPMTERERYFRVALSESLAHRPGQFVMVSLPGIGEAPISISCGPRDDNVLEMVVRNAGSLTQVLHTLEVGSSIGIRGPFGSGFDLDDFFGRDLVLVAGGLGLAPLRSLIQSVVADADRFGRVTIISGCRTPAEELFRDESRSWADNPNIDVIRMVDDTAHQSWDGRVGLVTAPISDLVLDADNCVAALVGPPVMYKFVIMELIALGLSHSQIFVDLERRMKCGVGKCGHCQINDLYCCQQGPVFRLSDIATLREAFK